MGLSLVFRIFYNSFFAILSIALLGLLLITPADIIQHAFANGARLDPLVVFLCYGGTIVCVLFGYGFELWTTRRVLAAIPRTTVGKGDLNKKARKMILESLNRSMAIGRAARPHAAPQLMTTANQDNEVTPTQAVDGGQDTDTKEEKRSQRIFERKRKQRENAEDTGAIPPTYPVWGEISHTGWSSPLSPDLPNLQFITVILELPHLIEARAVSLAPPDPESNSQPPMPDLGAVDLLQRPQGMGLRDYIAELTNLGVISSPSTAASFLTSYEYARFSGAYLTESQFRSLMSEFSNLLRSMKPLSPSLLESASTSLAPESDIDEDASSTPTEATPSIHSIHSIPSISSLGRSLSSHSGSHGTIRTAPSRRPGTTASVRTASRPGEFTTAPATPRSRRRGVERMSSMNSFAQSRVPYTPGSGASSSSSSMSLRSSSQRSVIRLRTAGEDGELPEVPYMLSIPTTR